MREQKPYSGVTIEWQQFGGVTIAIAYGATVLAAGDGSWGVMRKRGGIHGSANDWDSAQRAALEAAAAWHARREREGGGSDGDCD